MGAKLDEVFMMGLDGMVGGRAEMAKEIGLGGFESGVGRGDGFWISVLLYLEIVCGGEGHFGSVNNDSVGFHLVCYTVFLISLVLKFIPSYASLFSITSYPKYPSLPTHPQNLPTP